jgi:hypothetical protein
VNHPIDGRNIRFLEIEDWRCTSQRHKKSRVNDPAFFMAQQLPQEMIRAC